MCGNGYFPSEDEEAVTQRASVFFQYYMTQNLWYLILNSCLKVKPVSSLCPSYT